MARRYKKGRDTSVKQGEFDECRGFCKKLRTQGLTFEQAIDRGIRVGFRRQVIYPVARGYKWSNG